MCQMEAMADPIHSNPFPKFSSLCLHFYLIFACLLINCIYLLSLFVCLFVCLFICLSACWICSLLACLFDVCLSYMLLACLYVSQSVSQSVSVYTYLLAYSFTRLLLLFLLAYFVYLSTVSDHCCYWQLFNTCV